MRARFSNRSIVQLKAIRDFIARDSPMMGELVRLNILASIARLEAFPGLGRKGRIPDTREFSVTGLPIVIVYRPSQPLVIIAVFHTAQDR